MASLDIELVDSHGVPLDEHHSVMLDRPVNTDRKQEALCLHDDRGLVCLWGLPAADDRVRVYPVADPLEALNSSAEHLVMARVELTLAPGERRQLRLEAGR